MHPDLTSYRSRTFLGRFGAIPGYGAHPASMTAMRLRDQAAETDSDYRGGRAVPVRELSRAVFGRNLGGRGMSPNAGHSIELAGGPPCLPRSG